MTGGVSQARALAALDRTGWAVPPSDCTVRGLQAAGTPGCLGTRAVAHVERERPPRERACGVASWPGGLPQACSLGPQGAEAGGAGGTAPGAGFQSHPGDTVPEAGWPFLRAHGGLARIRPLRPGEHGRSRPASPHFARAPSAAQAVGPSSPALASSSRAAAAADGGRRRLCGLCVRHSYLGFTNSKGRSVSLTGYVLRTGTQTTRKGGPAATPERRKPVFMPTKSFRLTSGKLPLEGGPHDCCRPSREQQKIRKGHIVQGGKVPEDIPGNPLLKNWTHARWSNEHN